MTTATQPPPRGVYTLTFYDASGDRVAVAITTDGRCVSWLPYGPGQSEAAESTLRQLLDVADPVPVLKVV
jgi:hypothetical protein